MAADHRLRTLRHDDAWGLAGRYNMRFNSDCISTIEKRLIKHHKITLNTLSQLSREILFASEVLDARSGALGHLRSKVRLKGHLDLGEPARTSSRPNAWRAFEPRAWSRFGRSATIGAERSAAPSS
jgi:hypothetical protein